MSTNALDSDHSSHVRHPTNRLSWLWLAVDAFLLCLTTERSDSRVSLALVTTKLALPATCIAPVFIIRFVRRQPLVVALAGALAVNFVAQVVACREVLAPTHIGLQVFSLTCYAMMHAAGYVADRLIGARHTGFPRTLVFPVTVTTVLWVVSLTPFGTWGMPAVVNAIWESSFRLRSARTEIAVFVGGLLAVLTVCAAQMRYFAPTTPTVRVAGVVPDRKLVARLGEALAGANLRPGTPATRQAIATATRPPIDDLFERSRSEARAGAKIVAWPEGAALIVKEDEPAIIERATSLAREERFYLQISVGVFLASDHFPFFENRAILIAPTGATLWDYAKSHPVPFGESSEIASGPGVVPVVDTTYGRLATVICWDADFPALVRQAGAARADILIVPTRDAWRFTYYHAKLASFRAIENGVAMFRPTQQGVSLAVDHQGRPLGLVDDLWIDPATLVVDVPTRGIPTVYTRIGDTFAYLCVAALAWLWVTAFRRREVMTSSRLIDRGGKAA